MRRYKRYLEDVDVNIPRSTKHYRNSIQDQNQGPNPEYDDPVLAENLGLSGGLPLDTNDVTPRPDIASNSSDCDNCSVNDHSISVNTDNEGDLLSINDEDEVPAIMNDQFDEDESSDENDIFINPQNFQMEDSIYPGAHITRTQSSALILAFAIRHHLTESALTDLLHLINAHTPTVIYHSKYYFLQDLDETKVNKHFYCPDKDCHAPIKFANNAKLDQCENELCTLFGQQQQLSELCQKKSFFLHLPITQQLETMLNKHDFVSKLNNNMDTSAITSGNMYRNNVESGNIGQLDITLQWNIDGASATKSSKCSIWPIQIAINELPYQDRKENIILTGLWQGTKPEMNTFLRPFVDELRTLHHTGITLNDNGRVIKVHCLIGSVDSVARPLLQNIKQFNGKHGCSFCLLPGERIERGGGMSRIYCGLPGEPRTEEQHLEDISQVIENGLDSSNGVKGPSLVMLIPLFNIITSFVPDYMHNVLLGVVRWFLFEWLDGANSLQPWYIGGQKSTQISQRLVKIKPPAEITRPPRSLNDKKLWKASEFRSFLLYYSIPCLKGILPIKYLKHWLLLVYAMSTLLKEKIVSNDIECATMAIRNFVLQTEELYGQHFMTYNMHTLLHLPESVKNWGAPWDSSTFIFEHFNGVLLNLFSGTQHISAQIFKNYNRIKKMNSLLNNTPFLNWHPEASKLLKRLSGKYICVNAVRVDKVVLLGAGKFKQLSVPEQVAIEIYLGAALNNAEVLVYERCIYKGIKLCVTGYNRLIKRQNCTVRLQDNTIFDINNVIDLCDNNLEESKKCVLLGREIGVINNEICTYMGIKSSTFINLVDTENGILKAIHPSEVSMKCVKIVVNEQTYVCNLVNSFERD